MNKLILCEGKTDAILLSYYLGRTKGWTPCRRPPKGLDIRAAEDKMESAFWYQRGEDRLLICGVGGKDNFGSFFVQKIRPVIIDSQAFSKLAVVTDRDDRTESAILGEMLQAFAPVITDLRQNAWAANRYQDSFGMEQELLALLLIIPDQQAGALETLLLDAISEDPYDREIVSRSIRFVEDIAPCAQKYIGHARLKLKARLGVTWAIQSPGKEFHFIDAQIRGVPWESSAVLSRCFARLVQI